VLLIRRSSPLTRSGDRFRFILVYEPILRERIEAVEKRRERKEGRIEKRRNGRREKGREGEVMLRIRSC
jgi:hypothetical protein